MIELFLTMAAGVFTAVMASLLFPEPPDPHNPAADPKKDDDADGAPPGPPANLLEGLRNYPGVLSRYGGGGFVGRRSGKSITNVPAGKSVTFPVVFNGAPPSNVSWTPLHPPPGPPFIVPMPMPNTLDDYEEDGHQDEASDRSGNDAAAASMIAELQKIGVALSGYEDYFAGRKLAGVQPRTERGDVMHAIDAIDIGEYVFLPNGAYFGQIRSIYFPDAPFTSGGISITIEGSVANMYGARCDKLLCGPYELDVCVVGGSTDLSTGNMLVAVAVTGSHPRSQARVSIATP